MDKYLFLDFDGVITTEESLSCLCPKKLALLGQIIDATDCKLVISSSWRRNTVEQTIKNLSDPTRHFNGGMKFPFCDRIVGVTIHAYNYLQKGVHLGIPRGVEIKQWIDTHIHSDNGKNYERKELNEDFAYVILDDDCDMLLEQRDNFVQTDSHLGLSESDVQKAIEILNGTRIYNQLLGIS